MRHVKKHLPANSSSRYQWYDDAFLSPHPLLPAYLIVTFPTQSSSQVSLSGLPFVVVWTLLPIFLCPSVNGASAILCPVSAYIRFFSGILVFFETIWLTEVYRAITQKSETAVSSSAVASANGWQSLEASSNDQGY